MALNGLKTRRTTALFTLTLTALLLSGCSETRYAAHLFKQIPLPGDPPKSKGYFKVGNTYKIKGRSYTPRERYEHVETGVASWYGPGFHGKMTANGEYFDENALTAAHRTLQMPSLVRVTNLSNGKSLALRVNDRGPYAHNRVLDVSKKAAELLGFRTAGTAKVRIEVLGPESRALAAAAKDGMSTSGTEITYNRYGSLQDYPYYTQQQQGTQLAQNQKLDFVSSDNAPLRPTHKPAVTRYQTTLKTAETVETQTASFTGDVAYPQRKPFISGTGAAPTQQQIMPTTAMPELPAPKLVQMQPVMPPVDAGKLYVQAGSFSSIDNAETFKAALSQFGEADIRTVQLSGRTFHRVQLGPFDTASQAGIVRDKLIESGRSASIAVSGN